MHKKNYKNYTYLFLLVAIIFIVPTGLHADWEPLLPTGAGFSVFLLSVFSLFIQFWPLTVIIVAALIKMWLLKRKLSIPLKWKPMEKLIIGTLAETIVELFLLSLIVGFLVPAAISLVSEPPFTSHLLDNFKLVAHMLIALPFYCFLGAVSNLLLINLLTPLEKKQQRRYFKFGVLLSLIVPALVLIVFFADKIFSKPPAEPV